MTICNFYSISIRLYPHNVSREVTLWAFMHIIMCRKVHNVRQCIMFIADEVELYELIVSYIRLEYNTVKVRTNTSRYRYEIHIITKL